jgi:hypothetical protein
MLEFVQELLVSFYDKNINNISVKTSLNTP